nr:hypothetical protein CFP56_16230 [Quercus suber]
MWRVRETGGRHQRLGRPSAHPDQSSKILVRRDGCGRTSGAVAVTSIGTLCGSTPAVSLGRDSIASRHRSYASRV